MRVPFRREQTLSGKCGEFVHAVPRMFKSDCLVGFSATGQNLDLKFGKGSKRL